MAKQVLYLSPFPLSLSCRDAALGKRGGGGGGGGGGGCLWGGGGGGGGGWVGVVLCLLAEGGM